MLGIPAEQVQAMVPQQGSDDFEVLPQNHDAVRVFLAVQNQWIWVSGLKAMRTGLNYQSLESAMRMMQIEDQASTFNSVRIMEAEVLGIWAKQKS